MPKMTALGRMEDGVEYATDGQTIYQLVPGKDRPKAVRIEPEREARIKARVQAARATPPAGEGTPAKQPSFLSDMGNLAGAGSAKIASSIGRVATAAGLEDVGPAVTQAADDVAATYTKGLSDEQRAAQERPFFDEAGNFDSDAVTPRKVAGLVAESAPATAVGMGAGALLMRPLMAAGMSPTMAGITGGAVGEGAIGGTMSAGQVAEIIDNTPEETLVTAEPYQRAYHALPATLDDATRRKQAREQVKLAAMQDAGLRTAVVTAILGAPSGAVLGRAIGGEGAATLAGRVAKQGGLEIAQEVPQSAFEQRAQNEAIQQFADPTQDLNEGLAEAMVGGALAGGAMGAGVGAISPAPLPQAQPAPGGNVEKSPTSAGTTETPLLDAASGTPSTDGQLGVPGPQPPASMPVSPSVADQRVRDVRDAVDRGERPAPRERTRTPRAEAAPQADAAGYGLQQRVNAARLALQQHEAATSGSPEWVAQHKALTIALLDAQIDNARHRRERKAAAGRPTDELDRYITERERARGTGIDVQEVEDITAAPAPGAPEKARPLQGAADELASAIKPPPDLRSAADELRAAMWPDRNDNVEVKETMFPVEPVEAAPPPADETSGRDDGNVAVDDDPEIEEIDYPEVALDARMRPMPPEERARLDAETAKVRARMERIKKQRAIRPAEDDLLTAIAKAGGLRRDEAEAQGVDPANFGRRGFRIARIFTSTGKSFEHMAETLAEMGYPVTDDAGNYSGNAMLEAVTRALGGEDIRTPDARIARAEAQIAEEQEAADDFDPFADGSDPLLEDEEYDGLETAGQQAILDAMERARDAGVSEDAIEAIAERAAIQELSHEETIAQYEAAAQRAGGRSGGAGEVQGQPGGEARTEAAADDEPVLKPYTAEEIAAREAAKAGVQKAKDDEDKKAQADAQRDSFTLTGSDRDADVAASKGQTGLFDAPAKKPTKAAKTDLVGYEQARDHFIRQIGGDPGKENADGDIDLTDAQWAEVDRLLEGAKRPTPPGRANEGGLYEIPVDKGAPIDAAAHEAATSPKNDLPAPTDAQKDAGNYKLGHATVDGLNISIENPAGTKRRPEWPTLKSHYGYLKRTEGGDGEHIDVFIRPGTETSPKVFVVDQVNTDGTFDEHKVMMGWKSQAGARLSYLENYTKGWKVGTITPMTMDEFKQWLAEGDTTKPAADWAKSKTTGTKSSIAPASTGKSGDSPEATADDYANVIAKASTQLQFASPVTGAIQTGDLRNDYTEGHRKSGSKVSLRVGNGMVKGVVEVPYEAIRSWPERVDDAKQGMDDAKQRPLTKPDSPPAPKVSANTIFTEDAAEAARRILKTKLGQLNSGIDPEVMQAGITLAGYHIEKGARKFAAFARAMVADIGDIVRPYLKSWYMAVKYDPRASEEARNEMSSGEEVDRADVDAILADEADDEAPAGDPDEAVIAAFAERLRGEGFRSITEARRLYGEATGQRVESASNKRIEELLEAAIVRVAREIAASGQAPDETFDALVALYRKQPNLNTRTSTSIENQAYSTPAPLAYLASRLAGAANAKRVLEPTAGNGMLLLEVDPARAVVNELNPDRAQALRNQGFTVTERNAATEDVVDSGTVDVIIQNPPFGVVKDQSGDSVGFDTPYKGYRTTEVDHAIVMRTLEKLSKDGSAVLIIGGVNKQAKTEDARSDAYNSAAKRRFFYHLHQNYNVVDHFTVAGELYAKQGAAWPIDVIVIRGRGKSSRELPAVTVPPVYTDWESLRALTGNIYESTGLGADDNGNRPAADRSDGGENAGSSGPVSVPEPPGGADTGSRGSRAGQGVGGRQRTGGTVRSGAVSGSGNDTAGFSGELFGVEQPGDRGTSGERGRASLGTSENTGDVRGSTGADQREERSDLGPGKLGQRRNEAAVTDSSQVQYQPASTSNAIGTLVPTNMQTAVQDALTGLSERVGSLDAFVEKELGYGPDTIGNYLSAEQVDALALALDQMKAGKGFIIGDQTGIGKGRVVAGVIRWALQNGKTPIFVTEKPNLYSDMYRDLTDIGVADVRPFMTNAGEKFPLDEKGDKVLQSPPTARHKTDMLRMAAEATLEDHNMIFTTYSQMQMVKEQRTERMAFLEAFAGNGVIIFDESHNAGGNDAGRGPGAKRSQMEERGTPKTGRAAFARQLAGAASAVFYSSATYAKRPSVMDLYFKTDMSIAVEGDVTKLPGAIQAGGVPLQQAVASMLAKAGQYIRRERSFAGVEYDTVIAPVDRRSAEAISTVMRAVQSFDEVKKGAVADLKKAAKREAALVSVDGATGGAGAESTNFTAIMHNLIDQMLLALKADQAADMAIEALKRGEKPVITVANTMGSFIESYVKEAGLVSGDRIGLSFKDLMHRYLVRSRDVEIKNQAGERLRRPLTDEELGTRGVAAFRAVEKIIKNAPIGDTVAISPIDWIHHRLRQAGYTSGEITGRTNTIEYSGAGEAIYKTRPSKDTSIAGRRKAITAFNGGTLDAILLNQAGSTGLSLHASEKFADQRRRVMVIAQPEKNIDTHMQMLGRVHRTGQVIAPRYQQMVADIPAEKRPAAVLAKKMASLNANTTASRSSQFTSKETVDFLNDYGDEVVAQLMYDMREVHIKLGEPLQTDSDGFAKEDASRKVTGRIPLLPVAEQEELYDLIEQSYKELLAQKEALGENILEAKTLELDAKTVKSVPIFEGTETSSPFGGGALAEIVDVKRLGKPYTSAQVTELVATTLGAEPTMSMDELVALGVTRGEEMIKTALAAQVSYRLSQQEQMEREGNKDEAIEGRMAALDGMRDRWTRIMQRLIIGEQYALMLDEDTTIYGVVTNIQQKKGIKNPTAPGAWTVQFAVADGARTLSFPLSKVDFDGTPTVLVRRTRRDTKGNPVMQLFDEGQTQSREKRVIVTGNLLAGFSKVGRGMITNYTTADGRVQQGILMPRAFDLEAFADTQPVELDGDQIIPFFRLAPSAIVQTADANLTIRKRGDTFVISSARSKSAGGKYYLDADVRRVIGDFSSSGNTMRAETNDEDKMGTVVDIIRRNFGQRFTTSAYKKEAESVGGRVFGKTESGGGRFASRDSRAAYQWGEQLESSVGTTYLGDDVSLVPAGVAHAGIWPGGAVYSVVDSDGGHKIGEVVVGITNGQIDTVYFIEAIDQRKGTGRRIMRTIIANSTGPVTIDNIIPSARPFWRKIGVFDDDGQNAKITWEAFNDSGRAAARVSQGMPGGARTAGPPGSARGAGAAPQSQAVNKAPSRGLSVSGVQSYLARKIGKKALDRLLASGKFKILASNSAEIPADAKRAIDQGTIVFGFTDDDGTTYLIADNLTDQGGPTGDLEDAYAIFMHEVGVHYGMRTMLGDALFEKLVSRVKTASKAKTAGALTVAARDAYKKVPKSTRPDHVDEEALAWLVTDLANHQISLVQTIIAKIRAFLVRLGFVGAATPDALVELARGAAVRAVPAAERAAMFARRDVTETPEFRRWFGDSWIIDYTNKPMKMYHGSAADFTTFDMRRGGDVWNASDSKDVMWFSSNPGRANAAARDASIVRNDDYVNDGAVVYPVYLSVQNPYNATLKEVVDPRGFARIIRKAMKAGHDGVIMPGEMGGIDVAVFSPEQIKSATGNNGAFDPKNPDIRYARREPIEESPELEQSLTDRARARFSPWLDAFRYETQDRFHYLRRAQEGAMLEQGVTELPEAQDAYLAELRYHGMAGAGIEDFQRDHVDPLLAAIKAAGVDIEQVDEFLHARHAPEANAQLRKINPTADELADRIQEAAESGDFVLAQRLANHQPYDGDNTALSGMSNDEAAEVFEKARAAGKFQALEDIGRRVDAITAARRALLVQSGLERRETIAAWEGAYQHYVPLKREGKGDGLPRRGKGFDTRGKEKRRAGSTRAVEHILANVVAQHEATIVRAEKAKVGRAMLEFARANPQPALYEVGKVEYQPTFDAQGLVTYRADPGFIMADNVFVVRQNGIDYRITFNDENPDALKIVGALKNLGGQDAGAIVNVLSKFTRFLSLVNTGANPEFIISNFARDIQTAGYNLSGTEADKLKWRIIGDVGKAWAGIRAFQKGKESTWSRHFDAFRKAGAQTGWMDHYKDIRDREKALLDKVRDMDGGVASSIKHGLKAIERFIEDENTAVENAIRLSAFVHAREAGLSEAKAARLAKELTVNFNRRGNMGQTLNALYLFFNASIQGQVRIVQAIARSRKVQGLVISTIIGAALLDIWNRAVGGGDDDEDRNPYDSEAMRYYKDRNLVVMMPEGDYVKIPLPWGYNVFHVMGQVIGEALTRPDFEIGQGVGRLVGATIDAFNPIGGSASPLQFISPTIADPVAQWYENKDGIGRPLRPSDNPFGPPLPESQKYWGSVRAPSKAITDWLNDVTGGDEVRPGWADISPEAIDLTIDTLTGGAGRFVADTLGAPWKAMKGEDVESYEVPLLRKVYGKPGMGQSSQDYYQARDAVALTAAQIKHYAGDSAKLAEIRRDHAVDVRMLGQMKAAEKQLSGLRKLRKRETDPARRRAIETQMKAVMDRFNRAYFKAVTAAAG